MFKKWCTKKKMDALQIPNLGWKQRLSADVNASTYRTDYIFHINCTIPRTKPFPHKFFLLFYYIKSANSLKILQKTQYAICKISLNPTDPFATAKPRASGNHLIPRCHENKVDNFSKHGLVLNLQVYNIKYH